jgi:hypothetical protein
MEASSMPAALKPVHFVVQPKGGVGKSQFARTLLHLLRYAGGVKTAAFDGDGAVGELAMYYGTKDPGINGGREPIEDQHPLRGVFPFDVHTEEGRSMLLDALDVDGADAILFDLPGAAVLDDFQQVGGSVKMLFEEYVAAGFQPYVWTVVTHKYTATTNVRLALEALGDIPKFFVVRNLFWGDPDDFIYLDGFDDETYFIDGQPIAGGEATVGGSGLQLLQERGGVVLDLPRLKGSLDAKLDRYLLRYDQVSDQVRSASGTRLFSRTELMAFRSYMNNFIASFAKYALPAGVSVRDNAA